MKNLPHIRAAAFAIFWTLFIAAGPVFAQREQVESVDKHEVQESHAAEAAQWFENFTNPMHDLDIIRHRVEGFRQFRAMNNAPAMKAASTPSWVQVGISQDKCVSGRGQCIAIAPIGPLGILYYGPPRSGLWKSLDRGDNWTPITDSWATNCVGAVAVDPAHPTVIYGGTGCTNGGLAGGNDYPGVGVYKSTDGGTNWYLCFDTSGLVSTGMIVNPANSKLVYLASTWGVFLSSDSGNTWKNVCPIYVRSIVMDPVDPSVLYAAGGGTIKKSNDSGKTWRSLTGFTGAGNMQLAMTPANHLYVYLSSATGNSILSRSVDSGHTWKVTSSSVNYLGQQGSYANAVAVNPNNADQVIAGGLDIYSFSNGGSTQLSKTDWTAPSSNGNFSHADIHGLLYIGDTLFALTDGGLYHSESNGGSWVQGMNTNLNTMQFVGSDAFLVGGIPKIFVGGAQDNGTMTIPFGGNFWHLAKGGDGGYAFVSQQNSKIIYGSYIYANLSRSADGGSSWNPGPGGDDNLLTNSKISGANFYMPYDVASTNDNVVAMCCNNGLFLVTDGFATVPDDILPVASADASLMTTKINGVPVCVAFAEDDENTIYVGTSGSTMYYTQDQAQTWTKTKTPLGGSPTAIVSNPVQSQNVYMTVGGKHFLLSTNNGDTWTKTDTNLPNLNYVAVAASSNLIFVGHDYGVLYSSDAGVTWYPLTAGMPTAQIMKLKVRGHYLIATTYGRGMYYLDISQIGGNGSVAGNASIQEAPAASISAIYPNPVQRSLSSIARPTIQFSISGDSRTIMGIYDVLGREERTILNDWLTKGDHETTADISGLPAGQHYIMLTSGGTSVTKPLTIEW